jgi:energy-coupling factor transporter ATP-binding protein EcfA2
MVQLSRLTIQQFRRVRPGTDLRFRKGLNLLVGRNGSGRTSLLDLVSAIATMDFSPLAAEELDVRFHAQFDGDEVSAEVVQRRAPEDPGAGKDGLIRTLDLRLKPRGDADNLKVHVQGQRMVIERQGASLYDGPAGFDPATRPGMSTLLDLVRQVSTRQELSQLRTLLAASRLGRAVRHDEALAWFDRLFVDGLEIYVMPSAGTGPVALSFLAPEWILDGIASRVSAGEAPPYRIPAGDESLLQPLLPSLGLSSAAATVALMDQADSGTRRFRLSGLHFERPSGESVDVRHLPFGHRRLLSLMTYLAANPGIAIIDELTNGLDDRGIRAVVEQLARRQVFLSATPLLLEHAAFDSGEDLGGALTLCDDTGDHIQLSELSGKQASAFYRTWKAGPVEMANFLRAKGLW